MQHVGVTTHGDKAKAPDILAAIRTLKTLKETRRPATPDERQTLACFPGVFPPHRVAVAAAPVAPGLSLRLDYLRCEGVGGTQRHGRPPAGREKAGRPR